MVYNITMVFALQAYGPTYITMTIIKQASMEVDANGLQLKHQSPNLFDISWLALNFIIFLYIMLIQPMGCVKQLTNGFCL